MTVLRRVARPLLASMFVSGGYSAVRDPARLVPAAESVTDPVSTRIAPRTSLLPEDPERLVRLNGAVQLGAGVLLALGRAPRLASAALAATLVPTTLAAHRFWTIEDPEERATQRIQFLKNASMLGGLLIAAADTHGKPSLAYRTRHTVGHASDAVTHQAHAAAGRVGDATGSAVDSVTDAVEAALKQLR
ncbi:DoxX family protein [Streptomyces microflavus]|nr:MULTISPECIES: DoxX family protein [Streptomyces]MDX2978233.1 DoxX family protein [Streptomyces sp. NRRL_B-2249]WSS38645.1 DoxX family protein [Streptomyces microflavus]WST12637.1 DoxX family protein [Streptomyces microflavus]